jgi:type I restriction enzyme S subunit
MKDAWKIVPLEKVLRYRKEFIHISDLEKYKRCRVQCHVQGIVLRDLVEGTQIRTKNQQICKEGDFMVAEIDAKLGGFGIVPEELEGAIVSSHYYLYEIDEDLLDRSFFSFFIRTPYFRDQVSSQGSTNYAAIRYYDVLGYTMPLPPIAEQRQIVARIEELAAKIEEARGLRESAIGETDALYQQTCWDILDSQKWKVEVLDKVLLESPRNGLSPQTKVTEDGRCMLRINAVSSSPTRYVDLTAYNLVNVLDDVAHPFTIRNDDVFIVRYNGDINRLAKAAIFKSEQETDIIYPDKLMRLRADQTKILPDFLVYALGSKQVRSQIAELGKTTAGQIGISGKNVKSFRIPVPPLVEQPRIVFYLDDLKARIDNVRSVRENALKEFDALLPTILDKAFKGEL